MVHHAVCSFGKQLKELPEEYLDDVSRYVQLLQYKIAVIGQVKEKKKGIILGLAEGKYKIPDDINAYDDEIAGMFDGRKECCS